MPQFDEAFAENLLEDLDEVKNRIPLGSLGATNIDIGTGKDKYAQTRQFDRIDFNPGATFTDEEGKPTDKPIYDIIFNPIEAEYERIMGRTLDLSSGKPFSKTWEINSPENLQLEKDLDVYLKPIQNIMSKDLSFNSSVIGNRRELLARDLGKELYSLKSYINNHPAMPPEDTDERNQLNQFIKKTLRDSWSPIVKPMIQDEVRIEGFKHSQDRSFAAQRAIPSLKNIAGKVVKRFDDEIGTLLQFLDVKKDDNIGVLGGNQTEEQYAQRVQVYADKVSKFGDDWITESEEELEKFEPTGSYSMDMSDLTALQGMLNPKYAIATASESFMSNILITGTGIVASALSPGKKLKIAAGVLGSAIPGYALESASAESEAYEELSSVRRQAKIDRKNMDPEEFKRLYTYFLGEKHNVTADELTDQNIEDIANRIGTIYGIASAGVEGVSTGLTVGISSKFFKNAITNKAFAKTAVKGKLGKYAMRGKNVTKWVLGTMGVEGVEEAIQESLNQHIIGRNVPFYDFDPSRVWKSAYAGGIFGGVLGGGTSIVGGMKANRAKSRLEKSDREFLQERKENLKKGEDVIPQDPSIKAGLFLNLSPTTFVDRLAAIDGEEGFQENAGKIQIRSGELAGTAQEWMNPDDMVKILKNKKVKENFNITEKKLMMYPNFFNNKQVADILGIKVSELEFDHKQIKSGKPKKVKKTKSRIKHNVTKRSKSKKRTLEDIERSEMEQSSRELGLARGELQETSQALADLEDMAGRNKMKEDDRLEKIKTLKETQKKQLATLKKLEGKKPKRKTKDPLAQIKQRLINRVNAVDTDIISAEQLKVVSLIKKSKTEKDLKEIEATVQEIEKFQEEYDAYQSNIEKTFGLDEIKSKEELIEKLENTSLENLKELAGLMKVSKVGNQEVLVERLLDEFDYDGRLSTEKTEVINEESLENQADAIHDAVTMSIQDIVPGAVITYSRSQLQEMNDAKLVEIAAQEGIDSSDRNTIIAQYLDNLGIDENIEELNAGFNIPQILIKRSAARQIHADWQEVWRQAQEQHGLQPEAFDTWAMNLSNRLPSNVRNHFIEWAQSASPNQGFMSDLINKASQMIPIQSDRLRPQEDESIISSADETAEFIKETISPKNIEDLDLNADSENIINTRAFAPFQTNINNEVFDHIVERINNKDFATFESFLDEISDPIYELKNTENETPVVAANNSEIQKMNLKQFYISKLPENFVPINRGKTDGVRKNIELVYVPSTGKFTKKIRYKDSKSKHTSTSWGRTILGENIIDGLVDDIVWLNKSDVKTVGVFKTRSEPLTSVEIKKLTKNQFKNENLVPLMMRNDSGRLILSIIKKSHKDSALTLNDYWDKELESNSVSKELAEEYKGSKLTDEQIEGIYGSRFDYNAAQISRHETLKKIFGESYHELSQQEIMLRNSIVFSTTMSNSNGRDSSIYVFNYKKDSPGDIKWVTDFENGSSTEINAIQFIDGEYQYIGDGATWTSERVFSEKYFEEVGAMPTAKRAKTVKFGYDKSGVFLEKHQEMSFSLPAGATKTSLLDGKEKIAEIRRDKDGINIYVKGTNGNFDQYVDHLASRDEAKVVTGKFQKQMNAGEVIYLPSGSTGHIQYTSRDKNKANFPMQVLNYINDEQLLNEVSKLYEANTGEKMSPENILFNMTQILSNGASMNEFIKNSRQSFPGSIPRMIENFADVGAGLHPSSLSLAMAMVKNRIFLKSQDFLQRGGVMDFRPSMTENIKDDEMIASADHSMRRHIVYELSKKLNTSFDRINEMSLTDLNAALKQNPVEVMMVRFPIPSQSGFRVMKVTSLELGLGDSFKVNPKVVKEVFEGDHDHDTGHITILDDNMTKLLKDNQVSTVGINIGKYKKPPNTGSIANINGSIQAMSALTKGKRAIGIIASLQRNHGVISNYLNSLTIDGDKIILKSLNSTVTDPDMIIEETGKAETQSLALMMRTYAQAAFDNPKLRLLDQWKFSDQKLIKMMFQKEDGSALTTDQVNTLSLFLAEHNKAAHIRNGKQGSKVFTLEELLYMSKDYKEMVENRENHIVDSVATVIDGKDVERTGEKFGNLDSIDVKEGKVHPMEVRAMAPYLSLEEVDTIDNQGNRVKKRIDIGRLTNANKETSSVAHAHATARILDNNYRTTMTANSVGLSNEQFKNLSASEFVVVQKDVQAGIDWGRAVHSQLLKLYDKIYSERPDVESKPIDPNSWDHNTDFNTFYHNLYNDGIGGLSAYKDLSETEKVAATFAFLDKFITANNIPADYVGKILPVSKTGITLLDPTIMSKYFELYNDAAQRHILGFDLPGLERIRSSKVNENYVNELRRMYGCE